MRCSAGGSWSGGAPSASSSRASPPTWRRWRCWSGAVSSCTTTSPRFGLLLAATGLLGVGFGLTVPVVNRLAAALFPGRVNVAILALNALLGLGTALAPVLIAVFVGLGAWWGLPITVGVLLAILLTFSAPLPRRAGAAAAAKEVHSKKFWLFCGFALGYGVVETLNGNWAILYMKGVLHSPASLAALALDAVLGGGDRGPRPLRGRRAWLPPARPSGCCRG